jgi:molybdenum cofactor cytidylyltransferase
MFLLGDQPLVDGPVLKKLIRAATRKSIVIPTFKGKQGNPVTFGRDFFPELDRLTNDIGGRALFRNHAEKIIPVPVETRAILMDLDTPEDYHWLCRQEGH